MKESMPINQTVLSSFTVNIAQQEGWLYVYGLTEIHLKGTTTTENKWLQCCTNFITMFMAPEYNRSNAHEYQVNFLRIRWFISHFIFARLTVKLFFARQECFSFKFLAHTRTFVWLWITVLATHTLKLVNSDENWRLRTAKSGVNFEYRLF